MRRTLALVVLLAACGGPSEPATRPTTEGPLLPEDRLELPAYDLAQYRQMIEELEGTPVVVNIWGSWCPPCRVEAPDLADVSGKYEGRVQFVGVDILDEREAARDFILEFDWQYPHIFDPTGAIRDGLGYIGQPVTIVHDAQGAVTFEWTGAVTETQLTEEIEKVL